MTLEVFSRSEQALRDTVIDKLESDVFWDALGELSKFYGIEWPKKHGEKPWRDGLSAAAMGPRGVPGVTLEFLKAVLQNYNEDVTVSINPAAPQRLTATDGYLFTYDHISRWVTIDGTMYYVDGPSDVVSAPVNGTYVTLAPVETSYWAAADFSSLGGVTEKTATWLPFIYTEPTPGRTHAPDLANELACKVIIWFVSTVSNIPPTYMQGGEMWMLFGSQTAPWALNELIVGDATNASAQISHIIDKGDYGALLLSNVKGEFKSGELLTGSTSGSALANGYGGDYFVEYDNESAEFNINTPVTGLTNTGGTVRGAHSKGDGTGLLVIESNSLDVHWDDDEVLTQGGVDKAKADGVGISPGSIERVAGEPFGGQIQENELKLGQNDVAGGPHPPYLIGANVLAEVAHRLDLLLASGCEALMKTP